MSPISLFQSSIALLSLLRLATTLPTTLINSLHLTINLSSGPPSTLAETCPVEEGEGFHPDPDDCAKFHRCVDFNNNGKDLERFNFDCGPGTVYDPDIMVCNHPWALRGGSKCYSDNRDPSFRVLQDVAIAETARYTGKGLQMTLGRDKLTAKDHGNAAFECKADGIFADPSSCTMFHICTKDIDGSFKHDAEVCGGEEIFCPPVEGCGPAAGCPVACIEDA